ncbi:MAG TPA: GNAT family N-acetyltransferase, partial [Dehalococcoidia bacterium]|nr:GNAT family N-acetyltransferase [Dehalococcoidia bacterium]
EYLQLLNSKQRHEVRRKLRRLEEAGSVEYRFIDNSEFVPGFMDVFLDLFGESRDDKAAFMTAGMEVFFRAMAMEMSGAGLLRGGVLELDSVPVAAIITFDFNDIVYLYNSSLTEEHRALSVGVLSKALCIRDSIERGKKMFDFLKGDEHYKYQLGGQEVQLYRCRISL